MSGAALVAVVGSVALVVVAITFSASAPDARTWTLRFSAALTVTASVGLAAMALLLVTVGDLAVAAFVALLALACSYAAARSVRELRDAWPPTNGG